MFYKYFVFIKEVVGNYLMSFIIKGVYYLAITKSNFIELEPRLISQINGYKHLILRI